MGGRTMLLGKSARSVTAIERHIAVLGISGRGGKPYRVRHQTKAVYRMRSTLSDWILI